uniref:GST C-terminal domain-containing protein n=1 Tax=Attheya septentrionalis TaxID=420275 RepID=A0A7S2UDM2_9STRA|eukprot:CAMPEP_0198298574 /NCGR_PEP_ID=MMETSP1449-20131203/41290_1 /TAXON_ID=420275 /ORGANISM="Attheya septentrionalis, Strain CCMP2084" /LENGTH=511 /DNA_ID=CAMNT_0043999869 /DNA_START=188 /DNA_END=1723 /DNA_ORIENTATION=-
MTTPTNSWTDLESKCGLVVPSSNSNNHENEEQCSTNKERPTTIKLDYVPSRLQLEEFSKAEQSKPLQTKEGILSISTDKASPVPWLVRDAEGVDPYAQQVWLALELKTTNYCTILVSCDLNKNDDIDNNMSSSRSHQLPQLFWPPEDNPNTNTNSSEEEENENETLQNHRQFQNYLVGKEQTLDMLESIQERYSSSSSHHDDGPDLYRRISECVDNVRCNIVRFQSIVPRNTLFLPHVPYQFIVTNKNDPIISLVTSNNHMVTLEETDEVLEEYDEGPWFCGDFVSAADVVWAPFLERYAAQLPSLWTGDEHDPRHPKEYPAIVAWFRAMECHVPCYSCRVAGDATTWSRQLQTTLATDPRFSHIPQPPKQTQQNPRLHSISKPRNLWNQYTQNRPWLAPTPEAECVAFFVRHRTAILEEALEQTKQMTEDEADVAFRHVLEQLLLVSENDDDDVKHDMDHVSIMVFSLSEHAKEMLHFLDQRLQVPRDMGMLPASTLRSFAAALPKPSIS